MREIKFRAWDGEQMILLENSGLQYFDFEGSYSLGFTVDGYSDFWAHERYKMASDEASKFPIMQFTGLHDRNGKEIYEGDIVTAWSAGSSGTFEVKWRQEASPCYILYPAWQNGTMWSISATEYKKGKQFIDVSGKITTCDRDAFIDDGLEIIGNIYENPELLKS